MKRYLLGLLATMALIAPLAGSAQPYTEVRGAVISSVQGSSFNLRNGMTIFMHDGTVINPTGTTLEPGMVITVIGDDNGNGTINANEVDVRGTAPAGAAYRPFNRAAARGWYDSDGNFHFAAPTRGYYDANGDWHPY